jgi:hypothetical protein
MPICPATGSTILEMLARDLVVLETQAPGQAALASVPMQGLIAHQVDNLVLRETRPQRTLLFV